MVKPFAFLMLEIIHKNTWIIQLIKNFNMEPDKVIRLFPEMSDYSYSTTWLITWSYLSFRFISIKLYLVGDKTC